MALAFSALWLDTLAVSLLWAWLFSVPKGDERPPIFWRLVLGSLRALPMLVLLLLTLAAWAMQFKIGAGPRWFGFATSLVGAYVVGRIVFGRIRSAFPSRRLIGLALLVSVSLDGLILHQVDFAIETRCRLLSNEALAQYIAGLPPAPTSENAATIYAKLLPQLAEDTPEDLHNTPLGDSLTFDPHEPATHIYLQRNATTLAELRRATTLPCRFDEDLSQSDMFNQRSLNVVRHAGNTLSLHARQALADGNVDAAIADAAAVLRFSDQHGHRPLLINALVAIGVRALGYSTVELTLPAITSHEQLAAIPLDQLTPPNVLYRQMLHGEQRYGLSMYGGYNATDLIGSGPSPLPTRSIGSMVPWHSLVMRVFIFRPEAYVSLIEHVSELSREPNYKVRGEIHSMYGGHATDDLMANILASSLAHSLEVCDVINAHETCLRVAMAMTDYRLDHGALPARLEDLTPTYLPAVPIDPFSGQPIKLVNRDNEWRVYSVGQDATDNGGVDDDSSKHRDIVVRIKAPAATTQP